LEVNARNFCSSVASPDIDKTMSASKLKAFNNRMEEFLLWC